MARGTIDKIEEKSNLSEITIKENTIIKGTIVPSDKFILIRLSNEDKYGSKDSAKSIHQIGNIIKISGKAFAFDEAGNPGQFDAYRYYIRKGYAYSVMADAVTVENRKVTYKEYARKIRNSGINIIENNLPEDEAGILSAMLFGSKGGLAADDKELYQKNGIMHIMAVSGLHVSMLASLLTWLISRLPVNFYSGRCIILAILYLYGLITGFSVSCIRAIIMIIFKITARMLGCTYDYPSAVSFAGSLTLIMNPYNLFGCDFLLSYLAVFSVMSIAPLFKPLYPEKCFKGMVAESIIVSMCAMIITMPVIMSFYYEMPLYTMIINIIIIPLMSLLMILGILLVTASAILSSIFSCPAISGKILAGGIHYILVFYKFICNIFLENAGSFRICGYPGIKKVIACLAVEMIIIVFAVILKNAERKKALFVSFICLLICPVFIMNHRTASGKLEITMLDIGQGDSIFIRTPDNRVIMVDGGSLDEKEIGKYKLEPFLRYKGVTKIDFWIISHMDADHYSGAYEVLQRRKFNLLKINNFVLSDSLINRASFEEKMSEAVKTNQPQCQITFVHEQNKILIGNTKINILGPVCNDDSNGDVNNSSVVFEIVCRDFSGLFTGDIEFAAEEKLLENESFNKSAYNFLKVAHHGSRGSSSDVFLKEVKPQIAAISAGKNNRYGHPHKEALERLSKTGARVYCTENAGAITVTYDNKRSVKIRQMNT